MSQFHRRFSDEQVRLLFQSYCAGQLARADVQNVPGIGRSRFFTLLKAFRGDAEAFSVAYDRRTPARLSAEAEAAVERALLRKKVLMDDADLPISDCNYTAMRERLAADGIQVSLTTMINQAGARRSQATSQAEGPRPRGGDHFHWRTGAARCFHASVAPP